MGVAEEAVQMAEAVAQPYSIVVALIGVGALYRRQGDLSHAIPVLQRSLTLCQEVHMPLWIPWIAAPLGAAYALSGRTTEALSLLTQTTEHVAAVHHGSEHGGLRSRTLPGGAARAKPWNRS
jgi:lipopolysaccharide biosynthesis regulator YciM